MENNQHIAVLGAGIIGVSTALSLVRRGYTVSLIDREAPASETSYGNAGMMTASGCVTLANPTLFKSLPALLAQRSLGFQYEFGYALKNFTNLASFVLSGKDTTTRQRAALLHPLTLRSQELMRLWLSQANESHRIIERGWLKLYCLEIAGAHDRIRIHG